MDNHLIACKNLWNSLLEYSKKYYEETGKFLSRNQLNGLTKGTLLFSQVAQNVADRLAKSMRGMVARKKTGMKVGFPRFKSIDRMKSFTYPQAGFVINNKLELSRIGDISIKQHREIRGRIKNLTIKKFSSGKWFAIFTSEMDGEVRYRKDDSAVGLDLGIEYFVYLSDGEAIENPRHLKYAEEKLDKAQRRLSRKRKGSKNRGNARINAAMAYERLANRRRDFLHKLSRKLVNRYSFIAMENLNTKGMARGFLAKSILDCGWAEFSGMLRYKAEEAGCEVVLVEPAHTSQMCSNCGSVQKKTLAERWHRCICGISIHRDLNAAINILKRATFGQKESNAWGDGEYSPVFEPGSSIFSMRHATRITEKNRC